MVKATVNSLTLCKLLDICMEHARLSSAMQFSKSIYFGSFSFEVVNMFFFLAHSVTISSESMSFKKLRKVSLVGVKTNAVQWT